MTDLWIGTTSKMVTVPAPDLPFSISDSGYGDSMQFENGGAASVESAAFSKRYNFAYTIEDAALLSQVRRLRQGSYGTGLIYFSDPATFHRNVLPAHWAEPGLLEHGWPDIYDTAPTGYAAVSSNSYDQPLRKPTWAITQAANTAPSNSNASCIIPIPPDHTLWLGVSGAATGTAVARLTGYNIASASSSGSNLTLLTDTASTRLNTSLAGSSYDYAILDFRRTTSDASTLTVTSIAAELWPTGTTPTLTGSHKPGEGNSGCRFLGGSVESQYRLARDAARWEGLGFTLIEVGAWQS
jgi:hypothetical protein